MNERGFEVVRLDEIPRRGRGEWAPVRAHLGVRAFGVNAWIADEEGERLVGEHDERLERHEELYFVASGRATFTVAGEEIDAPAGTFVFVRDPELKRKAIAREAGTTMLTVGGEPGRPFDVSAWELWSDVQPHYEAKEYDRAIEVLEAGLERYPGNGGLLYNLACCESLAGRREAALEHLREAIELQPELAELARSDEDFDPIRGDPAFASAVAGKPHADGTGP